MKRDHLAREAKTAGARMALIACLAALLLMTRPATAEPTVDEMRDLVVRLATLRQVAEFCTEELLLGAEGEFCRRQAVIITPELAREINAVTATIDVMRENLPKVGEPVDLANAARSSLPMRVQELLMEIGKSVDAQKAFRAVRGQLQ